MKLTELSEDELLKVVGSSVSFKSSTNSVFWEGYKQSALNDLNGLNTCEFNGSVLNRDDDLGKNTKLL